MEGVVAIFVCAILFGVATLSVTLCVVAIVLPIYVLARAVIWITGWKVL